MAGVVGQIVLGGLTVLFDLKPPFVMGHFLLSMVLVWNAVVLHHRAGEADGASRAGRRRPRSAGSRRLSVALAGVVIFAGTVRHRRPARTAATRTAERLHLVIEDVARVHGCAGRGLRSRLAARAAVDGRRGPPPCGGAGWCCWR